jgi:hypothetical protein
VPGKIFISYTSRDREWAHWIGVTLRDNGFEPLVAEWEVGAGENIARWMEESIAASDRFLCVFTDAYIQAHYSSSERWSAYWDDPGGDKGFVVPVEVDHVTTWPPLIRPLKRLSLVGLSEAAAEHELLAFLDSPKSPTTRPAFPGGVLPKAEGGTAPITTAPMDRQGETLPAMRPPLPTVSRDPQGWTESTVLPPKPKWIWWSTRESIEQEIPSVTAIAETLLAVPFYWWLAIHFETYGFLIFSACVAPLVLLRSDKSVALGVKWFTRWEEKCFSDGQSAIIGGKKWSNLLFRDRVLVALYTVVTTANWVFLSHFHLATIVPMVFQAVVTIVLMLMLIAPVGKVWTPSGLVSVLALPIVMIVIVIMIEVIAATDWFVLQSVGVVGAGVSVGVSVFIIALAVRIGATIYHFLPGFFSISRNFYKLAFCTSPLQTPELIPGLPANSLFTPTRWMTMTTLKEQEESWRYMTIISAMAIWFFPVGSIALH